MNKPVPTITEHVVEIIADILGFESDEYELSDSFANDLEADSLSMVQLKASIEDAFDVRIPDEKLPDLDTPAAIVSFLNETTKAH